MINTNPLSVNIAILFLLIVKIVSGLTASTDTLLWKRLNKSIKGVSVAEEAFILVPADYEDEDSPLIPINIRKFTKDNDSLVGGDAVNVWFIPGGPGQSSKTLELMLPVFLKDLPGRSAIFAIDHRGLGRSTPLASEKETRLLKAFPGDMTLLAQIVQSHQHRLGILTPITRALRVENVARDLLKGVELVKQQQKVKVKHYIAGFSYGTMIARRVLQIAPVNAFEGALLDGLAPTERIEQSNDSDLILQEFCDQIPECQKELNTIANNSSNPKVRGIIPSILRSSEIGTNSCVSYFMRTFLASKLDPTLCFNLHEFMNAVLLNGRASIKVAGLRLAIQMTQCKDPEAFKALFDVVHKVLLENKSVNQLQSAAAVVRGSKLSNALTSDELVYEVVSALERYEMTPSTLNICFNKKHTSNSDGPGECPSRLFDPCKFFKMTWDRKQALEALYGVLPPISLKTPLLVSPSTRIIVLAGNLDFNTPTWLTRHVVTKYTKGPEVYYHELFGYGHGIYGSTVCNREIFAQLLNGGKNRAAEACIKEWNERNMKLISTYFDKSFIELANIISKQ